MDLLSSFPTLFCVTKGLDKKMSSLGLETIDGNHGIHLQKFE